MTKAKAIPKAEVQRLKVRIQELETAIKKHRSQTGHHLCWENDYELWSVLKDKKGPSTHRVPPWDEFMKNCAAYRKSREGQP